MLVLSDSDQNYSLYIILVINLFYFLFLQAFQPHHGSIPSTIKHLALLYKKQVRNLQGSFGC